MSIQKPPGAPRIDLDALGVQIAGSGRSGSSDCWIWTLWESRLLGMDALGVQIAGSGRSGRKAVPEELDLTRD